MANEHMQTFAAAGFDGGVGSNFDYRQSSQPYQTHFKQPHTDHALSRPYSLQTIQGNLVLGLQENSQKTASYPHQRTLSASGTEHPGFQNLNVSSFQSFRAPPGFVNHSTPISNGHQQQQNTYQTSLNNGLMQNSNIPSAGANSYNQNFNSNFIGSSTSNVNGYTKGTAYDGKFDSIPKTTQNSLAALVDDDESEWERVIKNSELDATGDATQARAHFKDVAYPLGQGPLSPTHDLNNRVYNQPVTPGGSNISPWGIPSTAPIYTTSIPGNMNPPQQSAGYAQQSSYSQPYYQSHIQRTMSIGGNQFGYFNMHDRRPSAPVTMMSNSTETIGSSQSQDFYTGPSSLRPNSPPGNIYNTPQGMQLQPHVKSGKQAQNNITTTARTPDIHNASFRLPEWGLLPRLETHSQHLQDVGTIDLDYSIIKDVIDSDVGEVKGSMALYADSVDEIIPSNKNSSPTKTDIMDFQSHGIVSSANDGGNVLMSQTAHSHPSSSITPSVNGDGNIDYVIRQISPPNSSKWVAPNTHSGNDNFYANALGSGQVTGALPISPPVLSNNGHHAQQAFIRSISPVTQSTMPSQTSIGFASSTVSSNEIYSTGELAASLDQLNLGPATIGLNSASSTNDEVREGPKSSPSPSTSSAKKPLSWAAIAKTAAKPIPLNTTNSSEIFPPSQFSVSQSSAAHGTSFLPLMNSGIPIHGQPISSNSSQKTPPSSAGLGGSWAATAKSSVASRPSSGIIAPGKLTPSAGVTTMVSAKKELPPSLAQKGFNPKTFNCKPDYARYFVIKSYTEDDVHKSLKYDIWASTDIGNRRLDKAYRESAHNGPIYLFFSVNASGHFCGMAEMVSPVDYTTTSTVWAQDKWKGVFKVRWTFVKDIPNGSLRHIRLINNENKPVTNSRDTQELYPEPGREMLKVFNDYKSRTSILDDFEWYDQKQTEQKKDGETLEGTGDRWEEAPEVEE